MKAKWLTFTRKMKWVLIGTGVALLTKAGQEADIAFQGQAWLPFVDIAIPFVLGYIPKDKTQ